MYLRRLKDLREDKDEKQITIAELLRQQYSLYETGKRDLPIKFLGIPAKFYNTSTDYILELTDNIKPYEVKK